MLKEKTDSETALEEGEKKAPTKQYAAVILSVISVTICVLTVLGIILLRDYLTSENIKRFSDFVAENLLVGILIFMCICALQVIVAFVPGEAVETAAGLIFGPLLGTVVALLGIMLGSIAVILLVRKFGRKYVYAFYSEEKIESLPILNNPKKRNLMVFLLFFIPGTPKDFITYIVALTNLSVPMYLLLTTLARVPSILMSTVVGDVLAEGKILEAVIIFAITALISGVGYLLYLLIQRRQRRAEAPLEDESAEE